MGEHNGHDLETQEREAWEAADACYEEGRRTFFEGRSVNACQPETPAPSGYVDAMADTVRDIAVLMRVYLGQQAAEDVDFAALRERLGRIRGRSDGTEQV